MKPVSQWKAAVQNGSEEVVAKLLAEWPELVTHYGLGEETALLHCAAARGHEKVVAQLLAACPSLVDETNSAYQTALHFAAEKGHDKVVAQLLAASPSLVDAVAMHNMTTLHFAVSGGNEKVVAQVLATMSPALITSTNDQCRTALSYAAASGNEKVFSQLLAGCPEIINNDDTVLHFAAESANENIVERILALRPELITRVEAGMTPLRKAICSDSKIAERMLATNSDEVFVVPPGGFTLLHTATERCCSSELVAKLWRLNPKALRVASSYGFTPFQIALFYGRNDLLDMFQWSFSIDEIMSMTAFRLATSKVEDRYRPLMEAQCEVLSEWGNRDVLGTVFEYLGFGPSSKRARASVSACAESP